VAGVTPDATPAAGTELPLAGRVALVTGGGRGIGAATARELAARGAAVVVNYLSNADAANAVVKQIEADGGRALAVGGDVCSTDDIASLVDATVAQYGRVDIVVASAAIPFAPAPLADLTWGDFAAKTEKELSAAFHLTKAVMPHLQSQGYGRLIYVSSEAAVNANGPGMAAHSTAKAALDAFARCVAVELSGNGVTVNVVSPGLVKTDATNWLPPEFFEQQAAGTLLRRVAEPEDLASVIAFIASDDSRYMTGERITVDGGFRLLG